MGKKPYERPLPEYNAEVSEHSEIRKGTAFPFGAFEFLDGVNFAFVSRHATKVCLELFDHVNDSIPSRIIDIDPETNRTGDVWHVWVKGIPHGQLYAYRVDGPYEPENGFRYDAKKLLLDPYATAISVIPHWDFYTTNIAELPKCIFTSDQFDWQDDHPLKHPWSKTVIYETHVRGFTIHPSSGVANPGTYRGIIEKIPYLKSLGITAVELMPIQEFNENEPSGINPNTGERLRNYWGYNPVNFFAVKASYSSSGGLGQQILEFKQMVLALHQAGLEVIIDLVFNHTAERNEEGPTFSYRGIDNRIYYMLEPDKQFYLDFTGTGNTVNANHPVVQDHILSALRYWVMELHVDGFRFDEAAVFDRSETGELLIHALLVDRIAEDPILRDIKIIAEPWDATGYSPVGTFSKQRHWGSWNSYFRDEVRAFWRGDEGLLGSLASRLCGSADIYAPAKKLPKNSINYITSHDGFTLNDLVSYQEKHNEINGQQNLDGSNTNFSENYGVEGPTDDPAIQTLRKRQIKNFFATLFISRGVPMILGGDEFCRTQQGNNNAYCQDNEISWYDWTYLEKHPDIFRFVQGMIAFRQSQPMLSEEDFYSPAEAQWFNKDGRTPSWDDPHENKLATLIRDQNNCGLYLMFNADPQPNEFVLPVLNEEFLWYLAVDTSRASPGDIYLPGEEILLGTIISYSLAGCSCVILLAGPGAA